MKNWGGNIDYGDANVVAPQSIDELVETVGSAEHCRPLGSRHSFNRITTAPTLIDTSQLPTTVTIADDRQSVRVSGPATYAELARHLMNADLALANMASLPHISVAGAISTGTHGSGDRNQNLAASVTAIQFLTGSTELVNLTRSDADFAGSVVGLGAFGVITEVELGVVPTFDVQQSVYDGPTLVELSRSVDAVFEAGYSVSVFTHWAGQADQIWVKHRVGDRTPDASAAFLASCTLAPARRHPIGSLDASGCTEQLGHPGLWSDRLPHFQMGYTPSAGNEIQSEFFVDRRYASEAIDAMSGVGDAISDALMVGEIRTVAADDLWMSPHSGRDSLAFHFTWHPNQAAAQDAACRVADAFAPFAVRAHWGKVFDPKRIDWSQYPRRRQFLDLVERRDPNRVFRNDWFDEVFAP